MTGRGGEAGTSTNCVLNVKENNFFEELSQPDPRQSNAQSTSLTLKPSR